MAALNSPWVWRLQDTGSEQLASTLRYTRLGAAIVGMGFVLYLVHAELIQSTRSAFGAPASTSPLSLIFALIVFNTSFPPPSQARTGRG